MTILAVILFLAFIAVLWRIKPTAADVTITAIRYTLDDVIWIDLAGATLEPGYVTVAVTWKNNSLESVDTLMTLVVEDQGDEPDEERVTIAPNEEVTSALLMEFMTGSRRVTAVVYEEETMTELAKVTVSCTVEEAVVPAEGHIIAVMAKVEGEWTLLDGLTFQLNQAVPLVVSWKSDMGSGDPSVKGHITLERTKPDGTKAFLTATSGQDSIVAPGDAGQVYFSITFDQAGSWSFSAGGTVVIA